MHTFGEWAGSPTTLGIAAGLGISYLLYSWQNKGVVGWTGERARIVKGALGVICGNKKAADVTFDTGTQEFKFKPRQQLVLTPSQFGLFGLVLRWLLSESPRKG